MMMLSSGVTFCGVLLLVAVATCLQPHGTHWKGGAGVWHPIDSKLPHVGEPLHVDFTESLTVEPSVLSVGDHINVSWSFTHDSGSKAEEIIAAYCPETARDDDYIDYVNVPKSSKTVRFGPVVNMRCRYQFRHLHLQKNGTYMAVAQSPSVGFTQGTSQPTQGRLSETGTPGEMNVMWVSDLSTQSLVQYRLASSSTSSLATNITGKSHTYAATDLCNAPANQVAALKFRDPGFIHSVLLTGLKAATAYTYRYGCDGHFSEWFTFSTHPTADTPLDFFVYGDLGEWRSAAGPPPGDRAYTTLWHIEHDMQNTTRNYNMLLHVGDISYARGVSYQWEHFGDLIQSVATRIPYHVCIGNHEYDHVAGGEKDPSHAQGNGYHPSWGNYGSDSGGECAVPVVNRFNMPSTAPQSRAPFWYSYDYGMVHMVWLSTEHDYYPGSDMYKFLVTDLESVNRTQTPWVFLMGHRPMYTSRTQAANHAIQIHQREAYEDIIHKYGVDIFFTGHYHSYERTCAVYKEECVESATGMAEATVHLMVGMAGASRDRPQYDKVTWSRSRSVEYGYSRVHVANATHLFFEYVRNDSGEVGDSTWIVSDHRWQDKAHAKWAV